MKLIILPGTTSLFDAFTHVEKVIKPKHVFITQTAEGIFKHRLLGNENVFSNLPKRLYSVCFPKIHVSAVPENNRITIPISDKSELTLPYIPDGFLCTKGGQGRTSRQPGASTY